MSPAPENDHSPINQQQRSSSGRNSSSSRRMQKDPPSESAAPFDPRPSTSGGRSHHHHDARRNKPRAVDDSSTPTTTTTTMAAARSQQRRRVTNYTSAYTPPAELVAQAAKTREFQARAAATTAASKAQQARSYRKCSSLDRSEEDGDERQRRLLKMGSGGVNSGGGGGSGAVPGGGEGGPRRSHQEPGGYHQHSMQGGKMSRQGQQHHAYHDQQQAKMQQEQMMLQQQQQRVQEALQQHSQRMERRDRHSSSSSATNRSQQQATSSSSSRRSAHEQQYVSKQSQQQPGSLPPPSSSAPSSSSRHSKSKSSSSRRSSSSNNQQEAKDEEMTEQQRIEEYAGKRALLRLEQELADHSESQFDDSQNNQVRSVMDRKKLARVPQVKKSDLIIGEYLGRGNFCDVFEVTWILPEQKQQRFGSSGGGDMNSSNYSSDDWNSSNYSSDDNGGYDSSNFEASMENLALSCSNDLNLSSLVGEKGIPRRASRRSVSQICTTSFTTRGGGSGGLPKSTLDALRRSSARGGVGSSLTSSLRNPNTMALKCLRPAVRAQPRKFVIGAEDLAHETALLACLDHPNIIQLYGRAEGCFSTAFQMRSKNDNGSGSTNKEESSKSKGKQMSNEGYFIILDRLMTELSNRIEEWKGECRAINGVIPPDGIPLQLPPESTLREHLCKRLKVAYCIADALEYLHSRHVVFRDLKPANVGFDCNDCVKMFDFGFATSIAPLLSQPYEGYGPLTETCGTRRYMAPEVALKLGYGKEVDVYSFGMLLWEICALDKPFDSIQSVDEFHDLVVLCGRRPSLKIDPLWPVSLKNLMSRCWSTDPLDRPTMVQVKILLCNVLRDMNKAMTESRVGSSSAAGASSSGSGGNKQGTSQQRQEQGGNFIHKWRRRVSI